MRLYSINLGGGSDGTGPGGGSIIYGRAGTQAILNGSSTVSVVYSQAFTTANIGLAVEVTNTIDADPVKLMPTITSQSMNGFTVTFNTPADSANYILNWIAYEYV